MNECLSRLVHVFGASKGNAIYSETLERIGRDVLDSADDEMAFADALIQGGGLLETIGRSLRVRALLRGAKRSA